MTPCASASLRGVRGEAVRFLGVKLTGELRGALFAARVEQRFLNESEHNMEVVYSFPLPWGAVLLDVEVQLGQSLLRGTVVAKKSAEAGYEAALAKGDAAIMLERNADVSYTLNLGNLAAHETCRVSLHYAQTLSFEQGGLRVLLPSVIAPRYGNALNDARLMLHQVPQHSLLAEHPFELELKLYGELAHAKVTSPSHPIVLSKDQPADVLTLRLARQAYLDRDFVLVVDALAQDSLLVLAHDRLHPKRIAMLASFCPRFDDVAPAAMAVKILVDCSGSMQGDSLHAAKQALKTIIERLSADDAFSLSRFGDEIEHCSRGLWQGNKLSKHAALRWVNTLQADMGGTQMERALHSTFNLAHSHKADVLLITDGQIHAIEDTLHAAQASGHRLFIVGIGSSPAESHLRRLAEASGGACDFVAPNEAVMPAVVRMFARIRSPKLCDVRLEWPAGTALDWVSPLSPALYDGDTLKVFVWLHQPPQGELRLMGKTEDDEAMRVISRIRLNETMDSDDTLARMVASAHYHAAHPATLGHAAQSALDIALQYQLITEETNYLLLHTRSDEQRAETMPTLAHIAHMIPAGFGGMGTLAYSKVGDPGDFDPLPCDVPAFLRRQTSDFDEAAETSPIPELTPFELSQWLRTTPPSTWPSRSIDLNARGIGAGIIAWLELCVSEDDDEAEVIAAFLQLMASDEVYRTLLLTKGRLHLSLHKLSTIFVQKSTAKTTYNNPRLIAAMLHDLQGMDANTWPETLA